MCLGWGWYLQVDFQLFILGLLLLIIYKSYPKTSLALTTLIGIGSLVFIYVYSYALGIHITADLNGQADPNQTDFFVNFYITPWGRCTPYLMGLIFGMLFMSFRSNTTHS